MLQLFKSGKSESYIAIILFGILAWIPAFTQVSFVEIPLKQMVFYNLLSGLFSQFRYLSISLSVLATFAGAFLVNALSDNFEMRTKANQFPAFIYVLFVAVQPADHKLNPVLIGNLFILISWWLVFGIYRQEKANSAIFYSSVLLAVGAMFYFPLLIMYPVLLIAVFVLRPFSWREWCISLIGILLPFIYLFSYFYFAGQLQINFIYLFIDGWFDWEWNYQFTASNITFIIIAGIFFLLSLFVHFGLMSTGKVKAQNYLTIVFFNLIFSIAAVIVTQNWSGFASTALAIPLSFLIGNFFMQLKSRFFGEVCLWVLVIIVAISKFQLLG